MTHIWNNSIEVRRSSDLRAFGGDAIAATNSDAGLRTFPKIPRAGRPLQCASTARWILDTFWTHLCGNRWCLRTYSLVDSAQGPTKRVAVPKSVGAVKHVRQDVEAAVWMHAEPFDVYVGPVEIKQ